MAKPFMGKFGMIALALQTDVATVATTPTITLRTTQFAAPIPEYTRTESTIADGTRFGMQEFVQGVTPSNKQITAEAAFRDLPLLLTAFLGAPTGAGPGVGGTITPRAENFAALAPGQPLTVWQPHPLRDSLFPNAQISNITLNIQNRQNVTVQATLNTARVDPIGTAPTYPPLAATEIAQFLNWYVKIGSVTYAPNDGTIVIDQPMTAEDGAQGLDDNAKMFILGWEVSGPMTGMLTFNIGAAANALTGGSMAALMALVEPDAGLVTVETGFKIGSKTLKFTFANCRLQATNVPTGLDKIVVGFTAKPVGLGVPPVVVTLPATS